MITLNEKQLRKLVNNQDQYTLEDFGRKFNVTPMEVYELYSYLIDSGEYRKYWRKPNPRMEGKNGNKTNDNEQN